MSEDVPAVSCLQFPCRTTLRTALAVLAWALTTCTPLRADDAFNLTRDPEVDSFPAWSPDSTRIAFVRGDFQNYQVYFQSIEGGAATRIIPTLGAREPAWSPDAETLVWTRLDVLWKADLGDGGVDQIQLTSPSDGGSPDGSAAFAPAGDRIAFHTTFTGDTQSSIATIPTFGPAVLTRVTTESSDDKWPTWSPDGDEIAFSSGEPGNWNLQIVSASGGEQRTLVTGASSNLHPAWSPDGNWIAFASNQTGNFDIWMVSPNGGESIQITDDKGPDLWPTWSPDGTQIAFQSFRDNQFDIWIIAQPPVPIQRMSWGRIKQTFAR